MDNTNAYLFLMASIWGLAFTLPVEKLPEIETCQNRLRGQSCSVTCTVENFDDSVKFYHPPGTPVAGCVKGGNCSSRYNYSVEKVKGRHEVILGIKALHTSVHQGLWLCTYGARSSKEKLLKVYVAPVDKKSTTYIKAKIGRRLTLNCDIKHSGQSFSIKWYFNMKPVEIDGRYNISQADNTSLIIEDLKKSDEGEYHCVIAIPAGSKNTEKGQIIKLYHVVENQESGIYTRNTQYASAEEGENVTLKCDIDVLGQNYSIGWYFDNKPLELGSKYNIDSKDRISLRINDITKTDKGFYHCSVAIPNGSNNTKNGSVINLVSVKKKFYSTSELRNQTFLETTGNDQGSGNECFPLTLIPFLTGFIITSVFFVRQRFTKDQCRKDITKTCYRRVFITALMLLILVFGLGIMTFLVYFCQHAKQPVFSAFLYICIGIAFSGIMVIPFAVIKVLQKRRTQDGFELGQKKQTFDVRNLEKRLAVIQTTIGLLHDEVSKIRTTNRHAVEKFKTTAYNQNEDTSGQIDKDKFYESESSSIIEIGDTIRESAVELSPLNKLSRLNV